jgi:membrane-associated phospholipid phosphatase
MLQSHSSWKIKKLIFAHILVIGLVSSVFYPPLYNFIWKALDEGCFKFLSETTAQSRFLQSFWAVANHRIGDAIEDVFFVIFFIWLIKITPPREKLKKASEFLFLALLTTAVVLFVNNLLFKQMIHISRWSPSLILESLPRLADAISWIKVKGASKASFPSDHATTAVMFVVDFLLVSRNRLLNWSVLLYGVFLCCPRMVAGAHWLTDILCGSVSIVLIIFGWALFTPFARLCTRGIHKGLLWIAGLFSKPLTKR